MTVTDHPAVAAYLARFDAVSAHLAPARRQELRADLLEHLSEALPANSDDASVRAELDRLGPPEEIVRAEEPETAGQPASPPMTPGQRGIAHEGLAAVFLTVGSFVPVIGWLVGVVLLWTSKVWTTGEKVVGTLLIPGGPATGLFLGVGTSLFAVSTCSTFTDSAGTTVSDCPTGPDWGGIAVLGVFLVLFLVPFVVAGVLLRRAVRRSRA